MPSALVLGAFSVVGRHIVHELVKEGITEVRGVDYGIKEFAFLHNEHLQSFDKITYVQANLQRKDGMRTAFSGQRWDWVFNCTSSVKAEQVEEFCRTRVLGTAVNAVEETIATQSGVLVHLSTAFEYQHIQGVPSKEEEQLLEIPGSFRSKYLIKAEAVLGSMEKLPLILLRVPFLYGSGDRDTLTNFFAVCYTMARLNIPFPEVFPLNMERSAVHAEDVARAAIFLAKMYIDNAYATVPQERIQVFNCAPSVETVNDYITTLKESFPGYKYEGEAMEGLLTPNKLEEIQNYLNEEFLDAWLKFLAEDGIKYSPIQPYLDKEVAVTNRFWNIDGTKLERTGFKYKYKLSAKSLLPVLEAEMEAGIWPKLQY